MGIPKAASTGITTHPEVLEAIIDWIRPRTDDISIVESQSTAPNQTPETNFEKCGAAELSRRKGVKLVNLSNDPKEIVYTERGLARKEYTISKTLVDADVIINVPVLKTNNLTALTLGIKNLYGLWWGNKFTFHDSVWDVIDRKTMRVDRRIDKVILDLHSIFEAKLKLTVLDAIVGSDGYFGVVSENPRNIGFVCAGYNTFAVDRFVSQAVGFDPKRLPYLAKGAEAGLFSFDDEIDVTGAGISDIRCDFDLGLEEALKVMDAMFEGHRNIDDLSKTTGMDGLKLKYLLDGMVEFGYIALRNNEIKIKNRLYHTYMLSKTALIDK